MSDRIRLNDLTDDALDALYDQADRYQTAWRSAEQDVTTAVRMSLDAQQRAEQVEAALARVRDLHAPVDHRGRTICADCSGYGLGSTDNVPVPYPCSTVRALDEQPITAQPSGCPHCGATTTHLPRRYMKNGRIGYCHGELTTDEQPT
ncbi:hypothetical protein ACFYXM_08920 [Streptomyces sp. NPDC002476]|uniref:hypothetical protein n=1 Tax=Streptomyces sp. NPDC002476 TaxID=3364648 RepID=UPI0036D15F32